MFKGCGDDCLAAKLIVNVSKWNHIKLGANVIFLIDAANLSIKSNELLCGRRQLTDENGSYGNGHVKLFKLRDAFKPESRLLEANGSLKIQVIKLLFEKKYFPWVCSPLGHILFKREDVNFFVVVDYPGEPEVVLEAHNFILAARSTVIDQMLNDGATEIAGGNLKVSDFNAATVCAAIQFCYDNGNLDLEPLQTLTGLLDFSEKYGIGDLKSKLQHVLMFKIFRDTAYKVFNAAMVADADILKCAAINAINVFFLNGVAITDAEILSAAAKVLLQQSRVSVGVVTEEFLNDLSFAAKYGD